MDDTYTLDQVEKLVGLHESIATAGARHVTIADILSWARDPGADRTWANRARTHGQEDDWTARRGPLDLDSDDAATLFDFERAMSRLRLIEQAAIALSVMGFDEEDIGQVLAWDRMKDMERHQIAAAKQRVKRLLLGRERRDAEGRTVRGEDGQPIRHPGALQQLTREMNTGGQRGRRR